MILFNIVFSSGYFTDTVISPSHKRRSRNNVQTYRAISLLCTTGKIEMSTIILVHWAEQYDSIGNVQCAYRKHRSTAELILTLHDIAHRLLFKKTDGFSCVNFGFYHAFDTLVV